ncbi:ShlB/FhaC/HecB family hemolysin secretion/activation protein [Zwartia sp.]|uniref:ShlB/FhaC/HecB family hemolysin secretion/activation protein n=1 Tax=Zwartia sp. TaxID=2978004 RepID=UPI002718B9A4|nr:ShlB/FhaC/HecB family hemolysin secretion/activation protein [Zwartia sp.]MDO9022977.1 ShlB/FhaC/HecB family hemolysin secretion/activation protein [Zwartia sp.]
MNTKLTYLSGLLLVASQAVLAAPPPGGSIPLFQIPPTPVQPQEPPKFELEQRIPTPVPVSTDTTKIRVNSISIKGNEVYKEAELLAISGFVPGTDLTLTDLRAISAKIADYYHRNGYFLTQAYLPAQDIKEGVVTIAVVVGRYGKVTINNETNLSDGLANNLISGVDSGELVESGPLETRLLLLSDLAGVKVNSALVPGAEPGTSDLNVNLTPGRRVTGSIDGDNAGLPATGKYRLGGTVNINNLAGLGDVASFRILSSGNGMTYGRGSYQFQLGRATIGAAYTQIGYALGKEFSDLGAHGTAKIVSVYGSYPLIRTRDSNLYAQLGFDARAYEDKVDLNSLVTNKRANVLMPGIYGNHRDNFGGGGLTAYGLTLSLGDLNIQSDIARDFDQATTKTNGRYNKLAFNAMRLQRVTDSVSFYAAINGQIASKNLDIWEKMELGGMYGVRAYPAGTAFGDQGYIVNLEARYLLPTWSEGIPGKMHLLALFDTGTVNYNKNTWTNTDNRVTLSGAGVGFMWSDPDNFAVKGYYARKIGSSPDTINSSASGQFWLQFVKYF